VLAQLRAIANKKERITVGILKSVYKQELKPVHPMLNALRSGDADKILENGEVDMVISATNTISNMFSCEYLFSPTYICIMNLNHRFVKAGMTLEEFASEDHLMVSLSGDIIGPTDRALFQHGLSRRIAATVNHFSSVANLIKRSNLICVLPISAVVENLIAGEIVGIKLPVELVPQQVSVVWHKRQDGDLGLIWLRQHFRRIITHSIEREKSLVIQSSCL